MKNGIVVSLLAIVAIALIFLLADYSYETGGGVWVFVFFCGSMLLIFAATVLFGILVDSGDGFEEEMENERNQNDDGV